MTRKRLSVYCFMSKKIEITFGVGKTEYGEAINPEMAEIEIKAIKALSAHLFGGYSMHCIEGGWKDEAGAVVEEPGRLLVLLVEKVRKGFVDVVVNEIKERLFQKTVVVTITNCDTKFV